jgi:flagellar hook-basal body complex protein FliE
MAAITHIANQIAPPLDIPRFGAANASGFQDMLAGAIQTVEQNQASAQNAAQQFLSGDNDDLHKVAIASQRADLSSSLFLQVRNKVISAYQEIMRMQM